MTGPYKYENLPDVFKDNMKKIGDVSYYDDNMCEAFVKEYFPEALEYYNSLIPGAFKSDFWRVMILLKFGGTYMDMGFQVVSPLENYKEFNFVSVIDGDQQRIYQAFMWAKPNCLVLQMAYNMILHNLKNQYYGNFVLQVTGPSVLGEAFMLLNSIEIIDREYYEAHGEKYKMLKHHLGFFPREMDIGEGSLVKSFDGLNIFFKTKFKGYYQKLYYDNKKEYYLELWIKRQIYKIPIMILILQESNKQRNKYIESFAFFDGVLINSNEDLEKICKKFEIDSTIIHPSKKLKFGTLSRFFSHLSLMKYIVDNNIPRLLYFEDDVEFTNEIKVLQDIYYDILYCHEHADEGFSHVGQVVSLNGAKKFLNNITNFLSTVNNFDNILLIPIYNNTDIDVVISDYIFCKHSSDISLQKENLDNLL